MVLVRLAHAQVVFVNRVAVVAVGDARQADIGRFDFGVVQVETFHVHFLFGSDVHVCVTPSLYIQVKCGL